jgi:hypothetical protein
MTLLNVSLHDSFTYWFREALELSSEFDGQADEEGGKQ